MKNWQDVPMPPGIAARPKDARGFPITFVTLIEPDGRPDFTTIDAEKILRCCTESRCGMCGEHWPAPWAGPNTEYGPTDHLIAFIGGPLAIKHRNFLDPGMHLECARYAMQVCPHIAAPTSRYAKPKVTEGVDREIFEYVDSDRPEKFGLIAVDNVRVVAYQGQPVFLTGEPVIEEWQE